MKNLLLTVSILLFGTFVHAQWFFETSLTNNQLVSYELTNSTQVATTPTVLKSINGIRDLSLGLGYLFSFQTLEQRMATDYKIPFVRLGLGLGFEQFTLRTNAIINNGTYPNVYAMAQAQGRLGVHLAPLTLYAKRTDDLGNRKPLFLVDVHGGISYNYYTTATQQYQNKLADLKDSAEFDPDYISYFFGVGLQHPINKFLQVYTRYGIDRAFEFTERADDGVNERYRVIKNKISVGFLIDLSASKKTKQVQDTNVYQIQEQLEKNTSQIAATPQYDDSAVSQRVAQLEQSLAQQTQEINQLIENSAATLVSKMHPEGFTYVLEYASIFFRTNSAVLNQDRYAEELLKLAEFLNHNKKFGLVLVGYADELGNAEHNDKLSVKRAKNIHDFLVQRAKVSPASIQYIGAGETKRFSENKFRKNRKTELLLVTQLPTKWNAFIVSTVDSASSSTVSVVSLRQAHQPFRSSHFDKLTSTSSVSNLRTLRTLRTPSLSR